MNVKILTRLCVYVSPKVEILRAFQTLSLNGEEQRISFVMYVRPFVRLSMFCVFFGPHGTTPLLFDGF